MNFLTLLEINPVLSSIFGLTVLVINYLFSYILSCKYKFIYNYKLNFIFFNVVLYLLISVILLFLLLLKTNLENIQLLFYLFLILEIFFVLFC